MDSEVLGWSRIFLSDSVSGCPIR